MGVEEGRTHLLPPTLLLSDKRGPKVKATKHTLDERTVLLYCSFSPDNKDVTMYNKGNLKLHKVPKLENWNSSLVIYKQILRYKPFVIEYKNSEKMFGSLQY